MARVGVSVLLLNILVFMWGSTESAIATRSNPTNFIRSSCRATRYPVLCVQTLSGYAGVIGESERKLAMTALSVSISSTRSCASFVKKASKAKAMKPREYRAVQDCAENMGDSVDRLSQSMRELAHMGEAVGHDFLWHVSNVQTWVSAALTDQDTCLDGFGEAATNAKLKSVIGQRVLYVSQLTSNALALVNRFASTH